MYFKNFHFAVFTSKTFYGKIHSFEVFENVKKIIQRLTIQIINRIMITSEIIKLLSRRSAIKQLENGNRSLLIRLKTVLKSFLIRLRSINFISPFGWQGKDHLSNQHRAPPMRILNLKCKTLFNLSYLK